jgi:streptomycin 3"-adenylyltransferase
MEAPQPVRDYARALTEELRRILGDGLTGAYLHGSAAMGGWRPESSDVDLLAVSSRRLSGTEKEELGKRLQALVAPGAGLEFSLVVAGDISPIVAAPPFELHVTTGSDAKVADGAGHSGDTDLVMHFAVCRKRGATVAGRPPKETLPAIPRALLLTTLAAELEWGLRSAPLHYSVLNACRAEAFAAEGRLLSKLEGARWALRRGLDADLVSAAEAVQMGRDSTIERERAEAFVGRARAAVLAALASSERD